MHLSIFCCTSSFFQIFKKRRCRWQTRAVPPCLYTSAGMPSPPEVLLHFICLTALRTSSMCFISSSSSLTGTAGTLSRLSGSTWESRFSRSVKCSFHRHRMPSLSFISVVPSFDLRGACMSLCRSVDRSGSSVEFSRHVVVSVSLNLSSFIYPPLVLDVTILSLDIGTQYYGI